MRVESRLRSPVLVEDKVPRFVVQFMRIVLYASFFFAGRLQEPEQELARLAFLPSPGNRFGDNRHRCLRHIRRSYRPQVRLDRVDAVEKKLQFGFAKFSGGRISG
jgi:hypothetical protein